MSRENHAEVIRILSCKSHFEVLQIQPVNATDDEVKRNYRNLALKTHPDKNDHKSAEEAFKKVHGAFQALASQEKRDQYTRRGGLGFANHHPDQEEEEDYDQERFSHEQAFQFFNIFMQSQMHFGREGTTMDRLFTIMLMKSMMERQGFFGGGGYEEDPYYEDDEFEYMYEEYEHEEEENDDDDDEEEEEFDDGMYEEDDDYDEEDQSFGEEDEAFDGVSIDQRGNYMCEGCNLIMTKRKKKAFLAHLISPQHIQRHNNNNNNNKEVLKAEEAELEEDNNHLEWINVQKNTSGGFVCTTCNFTTTSRQQMLTHVKGRKHQSMVDWSCGVCNVNVNSKKQLDTHLQSKNI